MQRSTRIHDVFKKRAILDKEQGGGPQRGVEKGCGGCGGGVRAGGGIGQQKERLGVASFCNYKY